MELLTVDEVSKVVKISAYSIREWLKAGKLKGFKPGGLQWRVKKSELDKFLNK